MTASQLRKILDTVPDDTIIILKSNLYGTSTEYMDAYISIIPVMIFPGQDKEICDDDGFDHQDGDIHTKAILVN